MNTLLTAITELVQRDTAATVVILLTIPSVLVTAVGLRRARQWYMLPVAFGLMTLAGFLLNPLADSNSLVDLRLALTSHETLTLLCIVQIILVALAAKVSWSIAESGATGKKHKDDRASIALACLGVLPAPVLVIAMLLIEQMVLSSSVVARPESVGLQVGLFFASVITLPAVAVACLSIERLKLPHLLLSSAMVLVCMFVPLLQDPLPTSTAQIDWTSLEWLALLSPIIVIVITAGYFASSKRKTQSPYTSWAE